MEPRKGHSSWFLNFLAHTSLVHILVALIGRGHTCNVSCLSVLSWQEFMKHLNDAVTILADRNIMLSQTGITVIFYLICFTQADNTSVILKYLLPLMSSQYKVNGVGQQWFSDW